MIVGGLVTWAIYTQGQFQLDHKVESFFFLSFYFLFFLSSAKEAGST